MTSIEYLALVGVALLAVGAIGALGAGIASGPWAGGEASGVSPGATERDRFAVAVAGVGGGYGALAADDVGDTAAGSGAPAGSGAMDPGEAAAVLRSHFDEVAGGDGRIDEGDLRRVASDPDASPALRDAASYLLGDTASRSAIDTGAGRGDVDGRISEEDLDGAIRATAGISGSGWGSPTEGVSGAVDTVGEAHAVLRRYEFVADTAAGRGGRDGHVSDDDLRAIVENESLPAELRDAARVVLGEGLEMDDDELEEPCRGWSCGLRSFASGAWDFTTGLGQGVWSGVSGTAGLVWDGLQYGGSLLVDPEARAEAWAAVSGFAVDLYNDPAGTLRGVGEGAWRIGGALVDHYAEALAKCTTDFEANACGRVLGEEVVIDVALAVATGGTAVAVRRGVGMADEVADAARLANRIDAASDATRAADRTGDALDTAGDVSRHGDDAIDTAGDLERRADDATNRAPDEALDNTRRLDDQSERYIWETRDQFGPDGVATLRRDIVNLADQRSELTDGLRNLRSRIDEPGFVDPALRRTIGPQLDRAINSLEKHLTDDDVIGAVKDLHGIPSGANHFDEVYNARRSLENLMPTLREVRRGPTAYQHIDGARAGRRALDQVEAFYAELDEVLGARRFASP